MYNAAEFLPLFAHLAGKQNWETIRAAGKQ